MEFGMIIGYIASICMIFGYLPQAVTTIRTRNTEGISLLAWVLMGAGSICFVIQGIVLENPPLAITNIITSVCSVTIVIMKITNDRRHHHHK